MTDRPIIFSDHMVLALLQGYKTQTRRFTVFRNGRPNPLAATAPGDRLWVRESFCTAAEGPRYRVTIERPGYDPRRLAWKPSIHMPRAASRLTLVVTAARRQRLRQIDDADAIAEGVQPCVFGRGDRALEGYAVASGFALVDGDTRNIRVPVFVCWAGTPGACFAVFWDSLHGPGRRWADDPEVVALSFEVHATNIDRMPAKAA